MCENVNEEKSAYRHILRDAGLDRNQDNKTFAVEMNFSLDSVFQISISK